MDYSCLFNNNNVGRALANDDDQALLIDSGDSSDNNGRQSTIAMYP